MKRLLARLALVVVVGSLLGGCSDDDDGDSAEASGSGSDTSAEPGPPTPPNPSEAGDPLPSEFADAPLDASDLSAGGPEEWQEWHDPTMPGWLGHIMPDCDRDDVVDPAGCEKLASAVEQAEGGDFIKLTPYPVDDEGLPEVPEGAIPVGFDQLVVVFPDEGTASDVLSADAEPYQPTASTGEDLSPAERVEGLGDAAWSWDLDLSSDRWDADTAQQLAGEVIIFRRGRVVVQILHTWVGGEEPPDIIDLGSMVDDRLVAAQG